MLAYGGGGQESEVRMNWLQKQWQWQNGEYPSGGSAMANAPTSAVCVRKVKSLQIRFASGEDNIIDEMQVVAEVDDALRVSSASHWIKVLTHHTISVAVQYSNILQYWLQYAIY